MQIHIRRNGQVIGTFDREDYLAWFSQGGACAEDEWTDLGGTIWQKIQKNPPFVKTNKSDSRSWSRRDKKINEAMNQVYKFRTWGMSSQNRKDKKEDKLDD